MILHIYHLNALLIELFKNFNKLVRRKIKKVEKYSRSQERIDLVRKSVAEDSEMSISRRS